MALVTIEIHARDVLAKLYKSGLMDVNAFDWLSQLRFYWEKVSDGQLAPLLFPKWPIMLFIRGCVLYSNPTLSSLTAPSWQLLNLSPPVQECQIVTPGYTPCRCHPTVTQSQGSYSMVWGGERYAVWNPFSVLALNHPLKQDP